MITRQHSVASLKSVKRGFEVCKTIDRTVNNETGMKPTFDSQQQKTNVLLIQYQMTLSGFI